jgi:hypothetical protein
MRRDPYLASRWRASKVRRALRTKSKKNLVAFLRDRYRERFFQPIQCLKDAGNLQGYGMAMMSLCSLLVESIQSCRDGLPSTYRRELQNLSQYRPPQKYDVPATEWKNGERVFEDFFAHYAHLFPAVNGLEFYRSIRNGLLHQAQTKHGWTIRVDEPKLCDPTRKIINRDLFAASMQKAFDEYLDELRKNPRKSPVWQKSVRKIWWLIRLSV